MKQGLVINLESVRSLTVHIVVELVYGYRTMCRTCL